MVSIAISRHSRSRNARCDGVMSYAWLEGVGFHAAITLCSSVHAPFPRLSSTLRQPQWYHTCTRHPSVITGSYYGYDRKISGLMWMTTTTTSNAAEIKQQKSYRMTDKVPCGVEHDTDITTNGTCDTPISGNDNSSPFQNYKMERNAETTTTDGEYCYNNNNNNKNNISLPTSILSHEILLKTASTNTTALPVDGDYDVDPRESKLKNPLTSSGGYGARLYLASILRNIQTFCQEEIYPIGSISTSQITLTNVKKILDIFAASYDTSDSHEHNDSNFGMTTKNHDGNDEHRLFNESINSILHLLVRLSREPSSPDTVLTSLPVEYYNCIFSKWKDAAVSLAQQHDNQDDNVWSAILVAQFLIDHGTFKIPSSQLLSKSSSFTFNFVKYNTYTVSLVLQAALHQTPSSLAPMVLESLWNKFRLNQKMPDNDKSIIYCYNILMQSYINSGHNDTASKIESVWNELKTRNVQPNMASYHSRLKFYRNENKLQDLENFLTYVKMAELTAALEFGSTAKKAQKIESIHHHPRSLSLSCWYEVVHCYMNAAKEMNSIENCNSLLYMHKGETILQQTMIPQLSHYTKLRDEDNAEIAKCINLIITTYRSILERPQLKFDFSQQSRTKANTPTISIQQRVNNNNPVTRRQHQTRDRIFESSISFHQYIQRTKLNNISYQILHGTMMDIYANAGRIDKVIETFKNYFTHQQDITHYNTLIKAYGNSNLANVSEQVLLSLLNEDCTIDIRDIESLFHTLIDAWAISSAPDATRRAYNVLQIMKNHPRCVQNNIRPNLMTYTTFLKCLRTISSTHPKKYKSDICRFAEEIITEMQQIWRFNDEDSTDHVGPLSIFYLTAIKLFLQVQDYTRAELILRLLENSNDIILPTKFYNELVHKCTFPATTAAAIQGEKILSHMVQLSMKMRKPSLLPKERLYMRIIDTWMKSNDVDACDRIWKIYDNLLSKNNYFELSDRTYVTLISYLATASTGNYLDKADEILQRMETRYRQRKEEYVCYEVDNNGSDVALLPTQPNAHHYMPVIHGYLRADDVANATKVLVRQVDMCVEEVDPIKKRTISPIPSTYNAISVRWIDSGQIDQASFIIDTIQDLYDEEKLCDGPCKNTYYTLLQAYQQQHLQQQHVHRRGYHINKYQTILNNMKNKAKGDSTNTTMDHDEERMPSQATDSDFEDNDL